jgi:hypothetical protein
MILIGLTGAAGAGKNTIAELLVTEHGFDAISFAEPIYAGLSAMLDIDQEDLERRDAKETPIGWLGRSPRELLQELGTGWGRERVHADLWVRVMERRLTMLRRAGVELNRLVITDVRFENEAAYVRAGRGVIWQVVRGPSTARAHVSEAGLAAHWIDQVIPNTGTPEDLRALVAFRVERLIERELAAERGTA